MRFFVLGLGGDYFYIESHSSSTESLPSETPRRLSQCRMKLQVN
jgi:hypothetical protein